MTEIMEVGHDTGTLPRVPGPVKDFVRGSMNSSPFRPGGLEYSQSSDFVLPKGANPGDWVHEVLNGGPPQVVPPGFKQGLAFGPLKVCRLFSESLFSIFSLCNLLRVRCRC